MREDFDKAVRQRLGTQGGNMKFGEKNVGEIDKAARAVLGIIFLCAYIGSYVMQQWEYVALAAGFAMVATAAYGTCPVYSLFGIGTCEAKGKKKQRQGSTGCEAKAG